MPADHSIKGIGLRSPRRGSLILLSLALWIGLCQVAILARADETGKGPDYIKGTRTFLQLQVDGKYDDAQGYFSDALTNMVSPKKLAKVWGKIKEQAGSFQSFGQGSITRSEDLRVVLMPMTFERAEITWRVAWDKEGAVASFTVADSKAIGDEHSGSASASGANTAADSTSAGASSASGDTTAAGPPPPYVDRASFKEEEVTLGEDPWKLKGTLTLPVSPPAGEPGGKTGPPVVVLVHGSGSGAGDRDETIGPNKTFRDLAWGLASRGVAVLRYEKRTYVYATKMTAKTVTVEDEVLTDVSAAVRMLQARPDLDAKHVFVLGHSLGGTLAPVVAERHPDLGGIILLAGTARSLLPVMAEQLKYIGNLDADTADTTQTNRMVKLVESWMDPSLPDSFVISFGGASLRYFRDLDKRDVVGVASRLTMPVLVLQGGRDYQVTQTDFDLWKNALSANPKAAFKYYPNVNHLFHTGEGKAKPQEYFVPGFVDLQVISDLADWIKANAK
jgi:uncharacterized protein